MRLQVGIALVLTGLSTLAIGIESVANILTNGVIAIDIGSIITLSGIYTLTILNIGIE